MLTVTETASAHLAQLLDSTETPEGAVIRIVHGTGENLSLRLDHRHPDDTTFEHEGRTVLVLDAHITQMLGESTLDMRDADEGPKLVLQR